MTADREGFDIRDGKHRYAPCPACGATEGMGLVTIRGSLAVQCLCGFRGPGVSNLSTNECDRQAFEWWNLLPRPKPEREHLVVSVDEMNRGIAEARLLEAVQAWLAAHEEGMRSRTAAERVYRSGAIPKAINEVRAAIAAIAAKKGEAKP